MSNLSSFFTMYITLFHLHSHNHHNLWKTLVINPMTTFCVTYMTKIAIVDSIK